MRWFKKKYKELITIRGVELNNDNTINIELTTPDPERLIKPIMDKFKVTSFSWQYFDLKINIVAENGNWEKTITRFKSYMEQLNDGLNELYDG